MDRNQLVKLATESLDDANEAWENLSVTKASGSVTAHMAAEIFRVRVRQEERYERERWNGPTGGD
ncbi:MAG: hypothetical protein A3B99_00310 [Candidatus Yanofskybacteria bacterium RIFCSPHIGHO2_02_FULL_44_12b]|uniref:Uncharacterized protein n=2 Tax=Candidatus Yanofskyibacteriota TaxID=1752733 RepID=A0A1F8GLQ3_9BACT|nr:MAG: hypothetical protein UW79_C0006G0028 [Candidatus Yanofskybacteria bacterium GW2011_GWA2_44_9]OGN04194.1 MAG: hypothetical protein A2659_01755 [Candidatus Yanofskybacteria bacterium RIFCSPHIGHO2_01_FULL_44_24]OGN14788.1 MAG: hypothetical protein A3B99_00310 [Candidatus Yanofskybacteria bacterium RIFCSPHIGHO2_02_FULL_44_12b]OGN25920.1 MAG: hypothetical protein A2925_02675 [Candidatus Yanofskybacteria bacterium RIFCSPLOWO2_01_FULL_44_22]